MHTPGANGRARGSSIATSNKCLQCKGKKKSGEIRSKTSSSSSPGEHPNHPDEPQHSPNRSSPTREARYECNTSRRHLATVRSLRSQPVSPARLDRFGGKKLIRGLGSYALDPPVTQVTLSELDVPRIIFNPKLRHDVNFDPDLHFRPNLDGEKGRRKSQRATDFWTSLRAQLEAFISDREAFEREFEGREWCLPATLRAIGEILETLVPPEDRLSVVEVLNVELLMQEFSKGAADLERLAVWLARTLKSHCAPMRDEWVDEMVCQLTVGDRERDVGQLVQGLQTLLAVLEAMKLDVANHQIRCLRPLLIQDTISFEQTFFMKKIAAGRIDISFAHDWFLESQRIQDEHSRSHGDVWTFMKGFVNLLLPSNSRNEIPDTFTFDDERMAKLRADMLDAVNLHVCIAIFRKLCASSNAKIPSSSSTSPSPCYASPTNHNSMLSPTITSLPEFQRELAGSTQFPRDTGCQTHAYLDMLVDNPSSGSTSSPILSAPLNLPNQSSFSPKGAFSASQTTHFGLGLESNLRKALAALLDSPCQSTASSPCTSPSPTSPSPTTTPPQRWTAAIPSLALQILRHTPIELSHLPAFENFLSQQLSCPSSPLFREAEASLLASMYANLDELLKSYLSLTTMGLFEAAGRGAAAVPLVSGYGTGSGLAEAECPDGDRGLKANENGEEKDLGEIARLVAHVGILHWRVWAPLVYLVDAGGVAAEGGKIQRGRSLRRDGSQD